MRCAMAALAGRDEAVDICAESRALAERSRWRTARLGDGELVIRLGGARAEVAHAGCWAEALWYLLKFRFVR